MFVFRCCNCQRGWSANNYDEYGCQQCKQRAKEATKRDEEAKRSDIADVLARAGGGPFKYGRVFLLGETGCGKTATRKSLVGDRSPIGGSTVGVDESMMTVDTSNVLAAEKWEPFNRAARKEATQAMAKAYIQKKQPPEAPGTSAAAVSVAGESIVSYYAGGTSEPPAVAYATAEAAVADSATAEAVQQNMEEVVGLLKSGLSVEEEEPLKLSISDCGGQQVFYMLHSTLLSPLGMYLLVFDLEWFKGKERGSADVEKHLSFLRFWLDSIVVHTRSKEGTCAPIALVGTHGDAVTKLDELNDISKLLADEFEESEAWDDVAMFERESDGRLLCFHPIDNTKTARGAEDAVVGQLRRTICDSILAQDYTQKRVPFEWLAVYDALQRHPHRALRKQDFLDLARNHGVTDTAHALCLLRFLADLGLLMYHPEEALASLVVLKPVDFLVQPATRFIADKNEHKIPEQVQARKEGKRQQLKDLHTKGELDGELLDVLWRAYKDYAKELIILLHKFGFIIPVSADKFLVPPLFPVKAVDPRLPKLKVWLAFGLADDVDKWCKTGYVTLSDIAAKGFLPVSLFHFLLGKAVTHSLAGGKTLDGLELSCESAILAFRDHGFRLSLEASRRLVCIDLFVDHGTVVPRQLEEHANKVIEERYTSLRCCLLVPSAGVSPPSPLVDGATLCAVDFLRNRMHASEMVQLSRVDSVSAAEVLRRFGPVLPPSGMSGAFDTFNSYNWNEQDQAISEGIFVDASQRVVDDKGNARRLEAFKDSHRLREGTLLHQEFGKGLFASSVYLPIVSAEAVRGKLLPLKADSPTCNFALEWLLILLELRVNPHKRCFPLFVGDVDSDTGRLQKLLGSRLLGTVPDDVCANLIADAERLLRHFGRTPPADLKTWTVRKIVQGLTGCLGLDASNVVTAPLSAPPQRVPELTQMVLNNKTDDGNSYVDKAVIQVNAVLRGV